VGEGIRGREHRVWDGNCCLHERKYDQSHTLVKKHIRRPGIGYPTGLCSRHAYNLLMRFDWSPRKARANRRKHGVSFEEAASAFRDPWARSWEDLSADGEYRWVLLAMSTRARLLFIVYTLRDGDVVRLITARRASRSEVKEYG
jgi:uncharacterized protein